MDSIVDEQRSLHEEREQLIEVMTRESMRKKASPSEQINSDHRVRMMLDRYKDITDKLIETYSDRNGMRRQEMASVGGSGAIPEFYTRLKTIRDYYRKRPNDVFVPSEFQVRNMFGLELQEAKKPAAEPTPTAGTTSEQDKSAAAAAPTTATKAADSGMLVDFTDEEGGGIFLDLYECYDAYLNLRGVQRIDYLAYLRTFDYLFEIPREAKESPSYRLYVEKLFNYIYGYIERTQPLLDIDKAVDEVSGRFSLQWQNGQFQGWEWARDASANDIGMPLDLSRYNSPDDILPLGADRLKSALRALGLKCGGTTQERANRLWVTKGRRLDSIDPTIFSKGVLARGASLERHRALALIEAKIYRLAEMLSERRHATVENVQRKQARTSDEQEEDIVVSDEESEAEDELMYNPKNLPLGWDGKPIPYWLYKLHGLNLSFMCEICGKQIYRGPKNFQQHFAEWRHAHGMRCLGIPNTAHFHNITSIEDALALWEKLKESKKQEVFRHDMDEEYEDSGGNVVGKKVYEDLKRQGLL